jgi:hypothetical protein
MWDMGIGLIEIIISEREVPDRDVVAREDAMEEREKTGLVVAEREVRDRDVVAAREDAMEEREKTGLVVAEPIVTNSAGSVSRLAVGEIEALMIDRLMSLLDRGRVAVEKSERRVTLTFKY